MKVLTISASPFLLTKLGRINSNILCHLKSRGEEVATASWDHDTGYFMNDEETGQFFFERENKKVCQIFPVNEKAPANLKKVSEAIEAFNPDVVVTIGDYFETCFLSTIKQSYPKLFKWVAVLTASTPIEESYKNAIDQVDYAILTTQEGLRSFKSISSVPATYCNSGFNSNVFYPDLERKTGLKIIGCAKNLQTSNIGAFLETICCLKDLLPDCEVYLHANLNDVGDYDIRRLIKRFGLRDQVRLPEKFVANKEGISDEQLREEFVSSTFFLDLSTKSTTGRTLLEALGCGCIPVVTKTDAYVDILGKSRMGADCFVPAVNFIGEKQQNLKFAGSEGAARILLKMWEKIKDKEENLRNIKKENVEVSKRFVQERFESRIGRIIRETGNQEQPMLVVDEIT